MRKEKITIREIWQKGLATENDIHNDRFPQLFNISSAMLFYNYMPRPMIERIPEFIYVDVEPKIKRELGKIVAITDWNIAWEAGHLRYDFIGDRLPKELSWLEDYEDHNLYLLPKYSYHRYPIYTALFHLIPHEKLTYFDLPLIRQGIWPHSFPWNAGNFLPRDFDSRLGRAFASHIWPFLNSGSQISAFSSSDSLKLLAHNLDFWLPYAFKMVENRLRSFGRCDFDDDEQVAILEKIRSKLPPDIKADRPLKGGAIWMGREEAWEATKEMVELADSGGKLRAIIEAIKTNRVEEDFSERWSFAREDFERKLYHKRSKVKVSFVELKDTIPVHGPESEVFENLIWEDFMALLNLKERHVVVCLRNGITRVGEISKLLGYSNHSPVSKALARIRNKARKFLDS